jgi:hypothetical protein
MSLSVIVLAFHQSADVLKRSLPQSKTAMPNAKFFVAMSTDDKEVQGICTALNVKTIQFSADIIRKDGALFNYAGIARSCMTFARNELKKEHWILITRPQVILDSRLSEVDLDSLAKDSLYGCGMKEIITKEDLAAYKPSEPSSLEVRDLVPTSSFLLSFSAPPQFDAWSKDTQSAVQRFSACFIAKYMIHLNLAYLGVRKRDDDEKVSEGPWGFQKSDKLRIEPVHAFAAQKEEDASKEASKEAAKEAEKALEAEKAKESEPTPAPPEQPPVSTKKSKLFGLLSGDDDSDSFRSRVRTELDAQQNVASFQRDEEMASAKPLQKKNIWAAKLVEE